jgi:Protein of unknown function (DUF3311)
VDFTRCIASTEKSGNWFRSRGHHKRGRRSNLDSGLKTHILRVQPTVCWGRPAPFMDNKQRKPGSNWWYLLLLVPFVGTLWVPFYNSVEPAWAGIPFFYWYQMLMVFIGAGITAIVYFATE